MLEEEIVCWSGVIEKTLSGILSQEPKAKVSRGKGPKQQMLQKSRSIVIAQESQNLSIRKSLMTFTTVVLVELWV